MEPANRLREAIKQTRIAIEETDRPDVLRVLEQGLKSLETALESLEDSNGCIHQVDRIQGWKP